MHSLVLIQPANSQVKENVPAGKYFFNAPDLPQAIGGSAECDEDVRYSVERLFSTWSATEMIGL